MDALDSIIREDRFNAKLKANLSLPPEKRKKILSGIDARERKFTVKPCNRNYIEPIEIPNDVPVAPMYGNTLPSHRVLGRNH